MEILVIIVLMEIVVVVIGMDIDEIINFHVVMDFKMVVDGIIFKEKYQIMVKE